MARLARAEIFAPAEIVAVHLIGKTVRSYYFMGVDERFGEQFDRLKLWRIPRRDGMPFFFSEPHS